MDFFFWKFEVCGQTVLPDRLILQGQKLPVLPDRTLLTEQKLVKNGKN